MTYSLVSLLSALLLAGSLATWAFIAARLRDGRPPLPWREREAADRDWLIFILVLAYVALTGFYAWTATVDAAITLEKVERSCGWNALIVLSLFSVLFVNGRSRIADYGVFVRKLRQQIVDGILGFSASILPVLGVLIATLPWRSQERQHPFLQLLRESSDARVVLWVALAAIVLAPLAEELLFRVILQGWLQTWIRPAWAIGIVAVLFAGVHRWPDSLPLLPLALILGYVYYRRNSYLSTVVLHALFNATNLAMQLLAPQAGA